MPRLSRTAVKLALPLALTACEQLGQEIEQQVEAKVQEGLEVAAPAATPAMAPEEQLADKLNLYVDCANSARDRTYDSFEQYRSHIAEDGTPKKRGKKQRADIHAVEESSVAPCRTAVKAGPNVEPPLPELEVATAELTQRVEDYAALSRELDEYYGQKKYLEDEWATSKRIAPKINAAFAAFEESDARFRSALDARKDEVDARMLAIIEERSGKGIEYFSRAYLIQAKGFIRCVDGKQLEATTCADVHTALMGANQQFRTYYEANQAKSDEVFWMSSFQASVEEYSSTADRFTKALGEGKPSPEDFNEVVREYNELIRDSNNLRFQGS